MSRRTRFRGNLGYGVLAQVTSVVTSIYLTAYLVRRLDTQEWGLVAFAASLASLLAVVQLAASAGMAKRLTHALARTDYDAFTLHYSTGVALCAAASGVMLLGLAALLTGFWDLANVPPALAGEGRAMVAASGLAVIFATMGLPQLACLQAAHRLDVRSKAMIVGLAVRAAATVALFQLVRPQASLYGLTLIASSLLTGAGVAIWVRRHLPHARFSPTRLTWAAVRDAVSLNSLVLFNSLNYVLFMQGPALLLQRLAGLSAVGSYGIALQVNNAARGLLVVGGNAISPIVVSLEATGRRAEMRRVFVLLTRLYAATGLMLWLGAVALGEPVLRLWLGAEPAAKLAPLPWLIAAAGLGIAAIPSASVLVALEQLRRGAFAGLAAAVAMLGLIAVALSVTALPALVVVGGVMLPFFGLYQVLRVREAARLLDVTGRVAVRELVARPAAACLAPAAVLAAMRWLTPAADGLGLVLGAGAGGLAFVAGVLYVCLNAAERRELVSLLRSRSRPLEGDVP